MWTVKKSYHTRLENLILGQLKIGKHQAKFKALLNTYKGSEWNLKSTQITFHVPMYPAVCVGHIWKRGGGQGCGDTSFADQIRKVVFDGLPYLVYNYSSEVYYTFGQFSNFFT